MAKARAAKSKKKAKPDAAAPEKTPSVAPAKPRSIPPRARSVPPPAAASVPAPEPSAPARWEERGDKDAYAFDLLERLVRYYGGRASASPGGAMRSVAVVLSTLSLALAADDEAQLAALAAAARAVRKPT
ncbi:MAG TPA: hypothetical protein VHB21_18635 [Minicystis sp.]|nr:hypothetical protein [Minicystis sp.]